MPHSGGNSQSTHLPDYRSTPRIGWHNEYLLSLFSFLMGGVVLYANQNSQAPIFREYGSHIAGGLFLAGLFAPVIQWMYRLVATIVKRLEDYSNLHMLASSTTTDLIHLRETLFEFLESIPGLVFLEIEKAAYVRSEVFLVLRRDSFDGIELGDVLTLLDFSDGMILGTLRVTELRSREYYAVAQRGIDPVFRGLIVQHGEITVLPDIKAIYRPKEISHE